MMRESNVRLAALGILGVQSILLTASLWRFEVRVDQALTSAQLEAARLATLVQHAIGAQRTAQTRLVQLGGAPLNKAGQSQVAHVTTSAERAESRLNKTESERAFNESQSVIIQAISNTRWTASDTHNLRNSMEGLSLQQRKALAEQFHTAINGQRLDIADIEFFPTF